MYFVTLILCFMSIFHLSKLTLLRMEISDPKSQLIMILQKTKAPPPLFIHERTGGPDHKPTFHSVLNFTIATRSYHYTTVGLNKKRNEKGLCTLALADLDDVVDNIKDIKETKFCVIVRDDSIIFRESSENHTELNTTIGLNTTIAEALRLLNIH